jgi:hypothetical protein
VTKTFLGLVVGVFLLGGCALPPALQIASWALDGISYITTRKSATDHGISILAQKDCAVLRVLAGPKKVCRDFIDNADEISDGMDYAQLFKGNEFQSTEADPLAEFEPAGGGDNAAEFKVKTVQVQERAFSQTQLAILDDIEGLGPYGGGPYFSDEITKSKVGKIQTTKVMETGKEPVSGYYTVIGSFRNHANARKLRNVHRMLTPSVLSAKLASATLYRVVVGPFSKNDEKSVKFNISQAGIADTWTIKVKPGDWSMAVLDMPLTTTVEVATAQGSLNLRNSNSKGFAQIPSKIVY